MGKGKKKHKAQHGKKGGYPQNHHSGNPFRNPYISKIAPQKIGSVNNAPNMRKKI